MDKINIVKDNHQKIYFTSDLHFGHRNILNFCRRPFNDIKDMEEGIIRRWNNVVTNNDVVFVLGDTFWFNNKKDIKRIFKTLNGKTIYVILGNHCDVNAYLKILSDDPFDGKVKLISDISTIYIRIYDPNEPEVPKMYKEVICSHYPLMTWTHRDKGAINLFGHIHSGPLTLCTTDNDLPLWKGQQYDVGADNNDYTPIEIDKILEKLKKDS